MTAESTFRAKTPKLMGRLMAEFGFSVEDAAAVAGNGGHESRGFTAFQEEKPTVKGSRGGWSWFQWTGPRRKAFEAFCAKNGLGLKSDEAATEFLILELKGPERAAIGKTKAAKGLQAKVIAFEMGFERAGVKHYPSRLRWAQIALDAYGKGAKPAPLPPDMEPAPVPAPSGKPSIGKVMIGILIAGLMAAIAHFFGG